MKCLTRSNLSKGEFFCLVGERIWSMGQGRQGSRNKGWAGHIVSTTGKPRVKINRKWDGDIDPCEIGTLYL